MYHNEPLASELSASDAAAAIHTLLDKTTLATQHQTFTLFPKLPTELRLKIFKHALPIGTTGKRIIQVKARITAPSRSQKPLWFILEDNVSSSDVKDVELLRTNKESRELYLSYFNKSLKAKGEGLIRYHVDDTIYICKYARKQHYERALPRPKSIYLPVIQGKAITNIEPL
jgi:hypothetical protein